MAHKGYALHLSMMGGQELVGAASHSQSSQQS